MLATLCQSEDEDIRKIASETLLSLGELPALYFFKLSYKVSIMGIQDDTKFKTINQNKTEPRLSNS